MTKANKFLAVCKKCGARCCKMGGPNFTEKEMKRVLKNGHKNFFFKVRKGIYELESKNAICDYLNEDYSCEIENCKPAICLAWPVLPKFEGKKKHFIVINCPLTKTLSKKQITACRKDANRVSKKLMDAAFDMSTVSKSIAKLIETRYRRFKLIKYA